MQDGIDGGVGQKQAARRGWIAAQLAPSSSTALPSSLLLFFKGISLFGGRRTERHGVLWKRRYVQRAEAA